MNKSKIRKKLIRLCSVLSLIGLIAFNMIGCGDEDAFITFNPTEGSVYEVKTGVQIYAESDEREVVDIDLSSEGEVKYTSITDTEVFSEMTYKDVEGKVELYGNDLKDNHDDVISDLSKGKYYVIQNKNGDVKTIDIEGVSEELEELNSTIESNVNQSLLFNNLTVFEGSEIEISLNDFYPNISTDALNLGESGIIKCKINKITKDKIIGELDPDSLDLGNKEMKADLNFEIERETGLISNLVLNIRYLGETSFDEKVTTTMKVSLENIRKK